LAHFHGHHRLRQAPSRGIWGDFKAVLWATGQVLQKDKGQPRGHKRLYARSLAFQTILALIPALAILMAVLSSDAFSLKREQLLDQIVDAIYPVQTETTNSFLDPDEPKNLQELNQIGKQQIRLSVKKFALYSQKAGIIGFMGFLVVVFLLMRDVENSFNLLWGVEKGRPIVDQMIRHATFFIGMPLLALILLTMKGWVGSWNIIHPSVHHWIFSTAVPFILLWSACAWMYIWIPNTKVEPRSAFLTGLMVAALLQTARWAMNWYTLTVLERSHVYGALWMIPVILIWFFLSWTVILFGAEVAFFVQKHRGEKLRPA
jgi:YihY family inner membrane protein